MKLLPLIILVLLVSCSTVKYVDREVPVEIIKKEYVYNTKIDSVIIKDSVDRWLSGDTQYIYKERIKYRYVSKVDTIIKTDSIEVPIEIKTTEIKEVNKIKWYQKALMGLGGIFLLFLDYTLKKKF